MSDSTHSSEAQRLAVESGDAGILPRYVSSSSHPDSFFERLKRGLPPRYVSSSSHPDSFFERLKRGLPPLSELQRSAGPVDAVADEGAACVADDDGWEVVDERTFSGWVHRR